MKPADIIAIILVLSCAAAASAAEGGKPPTPGDGRLSLYNYHEDEYLDVAYREGGRVLPDGIKKIQRLLRSRSGGTEHAIDPRLISLLDAIQDHFGAETVEIISGYRSPSYNRSLKLAGHGVASESLHMQGMAADIHLDEVAEERLFEFARSIGAGGVGIYPRYDFVHVDVGPARTWREASSSERILVGTENNPNPAWTAVTGKNAYGRGETLSAAITNAGYGGQRLVKNVWTERFRKGQWCDQKKLEERPQSESVGAGASARYAWAIPADAPLGRYRLVIFTSKDFSIPPAYSNEFYIRTP